MVHSLALRIVCAFPALAKLELYRRRPFDLAQSEVRGVRRNSPGRYAARGQVRPARNLDEGPSAPSFVQILEISNHLLALARSIEKRWRPPAFPGVMLFIQ
jgi:hypothetical protein